jgi:hypothetical protein
MRIRVIAMIAAGWVLCPGALLAAERVLFNGRCVDIHATAVPFAELLDELARRTGVQVAFEGVSPRQAITVDVKCERPTDALLGILEGQGLNYVLQMSSDGIGVEKLVLIASGDKHQGDKKATAERRNFPAAEPHMTGEPEAPAEPHVAAEAMEIPEEDVAERLPPGFIHSPATVLEGPLPTGGPLRIDAQPTEGKQITFPPGFVQSPPHQLTPAPTTPPTPPER